MKYINATEIPLVKATNENLKGYGYLIDDYKDSNIEIAFEIFSFEGTSPLAPSCLLL